ncbi:helix-turn-helix domain-containing protein [Amycolatopsis sp. Poz14]|uniref:helix-turn-helix domain-containing protein n=1 Tax=Amycolatopsis sp. Poz14 TaxID=1447705 RepID=UPI0035AB7D64
MCTPSRGRHARSHADVPVFLPAAARPEPARSNGRRRDRDERAAGPDERDAGTGEGRDSPLAVQPGATVVRTAEQLGMGRATVYRKLAQYGRGSLQTQGILLLMLTADLRFRRSAHRSAQEDS